MNSKEDNVSEHIKHLEKLLSILKADNKEPEWYERKPFKRTLCWVSNINYNPTKRDIIRLITDYREDLNLPFRTRNGCGCDYRYAVPISTNDLLEHSLEHQMEQENEQ